MKALTLHQPWASLVALGVKTIETRAWSSSYRGPLAIHAGAKRPNDKQGVGDWWPYREEGPDWLMMAPGRTHPLPLGAVIATCRLVDVVPITPEHFDASTDFVHVVPFGEPRRPAVRRVHHDDPQGRRCTEYRDEAAYGDFTPGRFAWLLDGIEPCEPVPAKGHQRLWEWAA